MTQEQNKPVRSRDEQKWDGYPENPEVSGFHWLKQNGCGRLIPFEWEPVDECWLFDCESDDCYPDSVNKMFKYHGPCLPPEARGAEEQRRKDAEGSLRPMSEAKKDRTPILAKIHDDLFPRIHPERKDLKCWNGRWVVISHTGVLADGFDIGWGVAAPVGCGGLTDDWFVGWKPVDYPANVAALEDTEGYLFSNPETGTEYLPYHPIESGECQYAENIRKATNSELLSELQEAWKGWEEDRAGKASLEGRIAELDGIADHACRCMSDGIEGLKAIGHGYVVQLQLRDEIEKIRAALTCTGAPS